MRLPKSRRVTRRLITNHLDRLADRISPCGAANEVTGIGSLTKESDVAREDDVEERGGEGHGCCHLGLAGVGRFCVVEAQKVFASKHATGQAINGRGVVRFAGPVGSWEAPTSGPFADRLVGNWCPELLIEQFGKCRDTSHVRNSLFDQVHAHILEPIVTFRKN